MPNSATAKERDGQTARRPNGGDATANDALVAWRSIVSLDTPRLLSLRRRRLAVASFGDRGFRPSRLMAVAGFGRRAVSSSPVAVFRRSLSITREQ